MSGVLRIGAEPLTCCRSRNVTDRGSVFCTSVREGSASSTGNIRNHQKCRGSKAERRSAPSDKNLCRAQQLQSAFHRTRCTTTQASLQLRRVNGTDRTRSASRPLALPCRKPTTLIAVRWIGQTGWLPSTPARGDLRCSLECLGLLLNSLVKASPPYLNRC